LARNKIVDFAQCGANFGETLSATGGFKFYGNIVDGGGRTKIREADDRVVGLRIGGGATGTATTNNHGDIEIYNNIFANIDATSTTADDCAGILIRSYFFDNIKVSNNLFYLLGVNANITYALYFDNPRINAGGSRNYSDNDVYETSNWVIYQSGPTYAFDDIASFNAKSYASTNLVENPNFTSASGTPGSGDWSLSSSSSTTIRTGGYDPCLGVPEGCEFDDAAASSRVWGTDWTQQKWSASGSAGFGYGAYPYLPVNLAPVALISEPTGDTTTVAINGGVDFDGTGTSDPEADSLTYSWDFNADLTPDSTVLNPPVYTYTQAGTFVATFAVTDTASNVNIDTHTVTVDAAGGSWTQSYTDTSFDATPATVTGAMLRQVFKDSNTKDGTYTKIRVEVEASDVQDVVIGGLSVCKQAVDGDVYDCADTPVRVTFDGGTNTDTITAGARVKSDAITFSWDGDDTIIVCLWVQTADTSTYVGTRSQPFKAVYFKTQDYLSGGALLTDETLLQDVSSYILQRVLTPVYGIEGFIP
jgi:hypothetical protein